MEKRRLIDRRTEEHEGRRKRATMTAEGRKVLLAARPVAEQFNPRVEPGSVGAASATLAKIAEAGQKAGKFD